VPFEIVCMRDLLKSCNKNWICSFL